MRAYAITRYIIWTAAAVVSMGAIVLFTLAQPPTSLAAKLNRPRATPLASETPLASRLPAAALPTTEEDPSVPQTAELEMKCDGAAAFVKTVNLVRLSGSSCLPANAKREFASVELLNDANGFSATVFYPTPKTFTTDYIPLAGGKNTIKILIKYASGEREERAYVITR